MRRLPRSGPEPGDAGRLEGSLHLPQLRRTSLEGAVDAELAEGAEHRVERRRLLAADARQDLREHCLVQQLCVKLSRDVFARGSDERQHLTGCAIAEVTAKG